ncbi:MAG: NUDIX hydrolase [Flavobacteriaceae bacterium]|nr:NUDIX hydrolase [Flavobacteriaceae bacterium]
MTKKSFRIAALAIVINQEGKILIGSSPRDGGYKFPQGGLDPDEDVFSGIKRELLEELGIIIDDSDIEIIFEEKVRYTYPPEDPYYIYKGQELSVVKIQYKNSWQLIPQDDEFDELLWIQPHELQRFDVGFRIKAYIKALEMCELL